MIAIVMLSLLFIEVSSTNRSQPRSLPELWFLEHARALGRAGAHVIATPRCTPVETLDTWLAGGRTCAVVAGAWSLSSNSAEPEHGGLGWAVDPEGEVVATTSRHEPFATVDVDLGAVDDAKQRYPRYVPELGARTDVPVQA